MSMVVQHNLQAMNSNRMLGVTTSAQSKSTEKLSSGYKINRAADDAAGLTISEKMRKQMRGLNRASTNAQDGVSSVQTAEGALTEVHSMLQRMNELAVQASNGTNSEADREAIQAEIDQLSTEIDRVAETTKFNEIYLLKGDKGTKTINMEAHDAGLKGTLTDNGDGTATFVMDTLSAGDTVSIGGITYNIIDDAKQTAAAADKDYTYTAAENASAKIDLTGWTNNNNSAIKVGGVTVTGSGTVDTVAKVAEELNNDSTFSADYVASVEDDTLIITAKDAAKAASDVEGAFDFTAGATKVNSTNKAASDLTSTEPVAASFSRTDGTKLYAENGTKELSDEEALAELEKGNTLYTTKGAEFKQKAAKAELKEAVNATAKIDLTGWTNSNTSAVKVGGATVTGSGTIDTVAKVAEELNNDSTFNADYVASVEDDTLIITAKDAAKTATDVAGAFDFAASATKVGGTDKAASDVTSEEPVAASYETEASALYAAGGTKALTDEEIISALENGDKLYSNAAVKGDFDITAKEAYALAKEELLKANQIGDTKGTANVEAGELKTAEDYKAGEKITIDGTEYTVADTAENVKTVIDEAITTANAAATTPANTSNGTAPTALGSVSDGTTTVYLYKGGDGEVYYLDEATSTGHTSNVPTGTDATTKYEALFAEGKTVTYTPATGNAVEAVVADDSTEGSTVISAEKAAELENAASGGSNSFTITTGSADVAKTLSFNLHVGSDADMNNKIQVNIDTMNSAFLGIKDLDVVGQGNDGGIAATYAIDAIADAISKVSEQRSALGAVQNRLEHTISNLDNVVENTTAAESRIRDTDMAEEMVEYSKNNILAQAGQSMLAQANQSTQGVLSLLG